MQEKIKLFWDWFIQKQDELLTMDELSTKEQEQLLDELQQELDKCAEGLNFEISTLSESGRKFVFSADSDLSLFDCVEQMVELSPELDWWEFIPFRQPEGDDIVLNFNGEKFETAKMYYLTLENEEFPESLGLTIALPNYRPNDEEQELGIYLTLEAQVGEYDAAQYIDYVELCALPKNPEEEGFVPLLRFPAFLEWFKENLNNK